MVAAACAVIAVVFGVFQHNKDETPKADAEIARLARSLPASSGSPPPGLWKVAGETVSSRGFTDGKHKMTRRWLISRRCDPTCGLWIARETSAGVERAPMSTRGGRWFATFHRRTDGCQTSRTGRARRAFAFSLTPDQRHIRALEINRAVFPDCQATRYNQRRDLNAVSKVTWEATLIGKDCDQGRCRVAIPDLGARAPDNPYLAEQRRLGLAACRRSGRSSAPCLCTLRRVLSWAPASVIANYMGALDHSQQVPKVTVRQIERDARACAHAI